MTHQAFAVQPGNPVHPSGGSAVSQIPEAWLQALDRFHRSTQGLQEAYRSLQSRVQSLNLELEETNTRLQENLREKERLEDYLRNILENLGAGIVVWDPGRRVTLTNRAARELLWKRGDGVGEGVEVLLGNVLRDEEVGALVGATQEGRDFSLERCLPAAAGEGLHLRLRGSPLLDGSGTGMGGLLLVEDITEIRSMEEEMARSQRLAAMGEMAAGIAHEMRNPLGSVRLFASLMVGEPEEDARKEIGDQIDSAIQAVDYILSNLLTFARPLRLRMGPVDPMSLLSDCLAFVAPLARQRRVRVTMEPWSDSPLYLQGDRDLLKQAILNLLLNAFQAMPQGGSVRAWVRRERCAGPGLEGLPGRGGEVEVGRPWVEMGVEDTGEGIPQAVLPRIFDPFFTTRPGGTGLGLAIVHNIVKAHRGGLRIQSESGKGTCVRLRVPAAAAGMIGER
jgi:PAS domain S-box-containing protein